MPRLATLLPLSPLYQHFNTLFGTLAHLSPQLFTLMSQTILFVVYNFYHLLPLSQSFAIFVNWHLNKHWLIWKVLQYTIIYRSIYIFGQMRVQLQGYIPSVRLLANTPVVVIYVRDHVQKWTFIVIILLQNQISLFKKIYEKKWWFHLCFEISCCV